MSRLALLMLLCLAGCATRTPAAREIFDEQTATTLTVAAAPLVFARDRSDVAAHARDYATLVAVEIDQSGESVDYLLLFRWSTVDRRMSPPPAADAGILRMTADGRVLELNPLERMPVSLQHRRALHAPEHGDVVANAYRVDPALLRFLAASHVLSVRLPQESLDTPFPLWEDGRGALAQFLAHTGR